MLRRRVFFPSSLTSSSSSSSTSCFLLNNKRDYRILPHLDNEIEELAETQKRGRWQLAYRPNYNEPPKQSELMCDRLNLRESRRNGTLPEKSIARRLSNIFAQEGRLMRPIEKTKMMTITVIGFDGHPYHLRTTPMPDSTLNHLIDGSGMNYGWPTMWGRCRNEDCGDLNHGDGCLLHVDLDTLDKLPVPGRHEYFALSHFRNLNRPDVTFAHRFSCQLKLTPDLDGSVFALKQFFSRALREQVMDWGEDDYFSTVSQFRQRKIEP